MFERYYTVDGIYYPIVGPKLWHTPCCDIPTVNLVKGFHDLCEQNNQVPKKDLVNSYLRILLMDVEDEKKILPKILPNGSHSGNYKYCNERFEYCYQDHSGKFPCKRGNWRKKASSGTTEADQEIIGGCLFSLVSFIEGCNTPLEAVECVAKYLDVNLFAINTIQPSCIGGYSFVENAHSYPPDGTEEVANWILGASQEFYIFRNKYGKYIFLLRTWETHGNDPIQLFMTRQLYKGNGKHKYLDTYIAPPWKKAIFNLHLIDKHKDNDVFIHDDIGRTRSWEQPGINTWSGEVAFVSEIEWDILKHRSVKYVFDPMKLSSCKIAIKLKKKFDEIATDLELIICEKTDHFENIVSASPYGLGDKKTVVKIRVLKSDDEFYDLAKEYHGNDIDKRPKDKGIKSYVRTLRDLNDIKVDRQFMVHPLLGKGEMVVLYGAPGVGKSFVVLDLVLMMAGGGSWNERFSAKQKYKILYIDAENDPNEFELRSKGLISGNYRKDDEILKNIKLLLINDPKNEAKLDISDAENRQDISELVKGVDLLVLDNLGTLTPSHNEITSKVWGEISGWIRSLNKKGTAVLLVHHENKAGNLSSTGRIAQNAHLIISLSEPSEEEKGFSTKGTLVKFQFTKTRHLRKDEKKGFFLEYNDENGQIDRAILPIDGIKIEKENKILVTEEDIRKNKLNKLDIDILNMARNSDVEFVTAADFKENSKGRKGQTVTDHFDKLVKLGLLERKGKNKGSRYMAVEMGFPADK